MVWSVCSLANQQLLLRVLWWQQFLRDAAFVWGEQSWNARSALTKPSGFRFIHGQTLLCVSRSFWDPFPDHDPFVCCRSSPYGDCPLQIRLWSLYLGPIHVCSSSDTSQTWALALAESCRWHRGPSVTRCAFPGVLRAHLCPMGHDMGSLPLCASPHLVYLPVSEVMCPSVTGTFRPLGRWGQSAQLFAKSHAASYIPKIVWNFLGPWSEWEDPTDERIDLELDWVCRDQKEADFLLSSAGEVAATTGDVCLSSSHFP